MYQALSGVVCVGRRPVPIRRHPLSAHFCARSTNAPPHLEELRSLCLSSTILPCKRTFLLCTKRTLPFCCDATSSYPLACGGSVDASSGPLGDMGIPASDDPVPVPLRTPAP